MDYLLSENNAGMFVSRSTAEAVIFGVGIISIIGIIIEPETK